MTLPLPLSGSLDAAIPAQNVCFRTIMPSSEYVMFAYFNGPPRIHGKNGFIS